MALSFISNTADMTESVLLFVGIFSYISLEYQRPFSKTNRNETLDLKSGKNVPRNLRSSVKSVVEVQEKRRGDLPGLGCKGW